MAADYKILLSAARQAHASSELITALEAADQGQTKALMGNPELVARALDYLRGDSDFSKHPNAMATFRELVPIANTSKTWGRRQAGSSGMLGNPAAYTRELDPHAESVGGLDELTVISDRQQAESGEPGDVPTADSLALAETRKALTSLTPREERVIRMRFGVSNEPTDKMTEQERADHKAEAERIREIERNALKKLRHPNRAKRLAALLGDEPTTPRSTEKPKAGPAEEKPKGETSKPPKPVK